MAAMLEDERFDGMLLSFAQQCNGIEPLLDTVFSFLRRKTDFFSGASPEQAKATIMKVLDKHQSLSERTEAAKRTARDKDDVKAKASREAVARKREEEAAAARAAKTKPTSNPDVVEITDEDAAAAAPAAAAAADDDAATAAAPDEAKADDAEKEEEEDKEPPPPGNGMVLENYSWTQQLSDLMVTVPVPPGTKSRALVVDIRKTKLVVGLKGQPPLIDGELHKPVIVDDCVWTLEGSEIAIELQKEDKMNWWKCVVVGDPEINTQKVQPENSKLSDLDGETRMTVEKMMFDQRQKALGKPSADEMQKQEVLEKFMKQHPEMDFSKAKMC